MLWYRSQGSNRGGLDGCVILEPVGLGRTTSGRRPTRLPILYHDSISNLVDTQGFRESSER